MEVEFDPGKGGVNQQKHGLSLADAARMEFETAPVIPDERHPYGEASFRAYGLLGGRLHMLAFTMRGDVLRAISLRKASSREIKRHG